MDTTTEAATTREATTYTVACAWCRATFNALSAHWCACLVNERTLECPHCGRCFCRADLAYKNYFWKDAPRELWAAKWSSSEQRDEPDASPQALANLPRPLVLVVDDEPAIRRMAVRVLRNCGYGVAEARDGAEGLERARELRPDLVLTDALMPKGDGRDMARLLKSDPALAGIRVLVMTAVYTHAKYSLESFRRYRVDDFLLKPISPADLEAAVRRQVGSPRQSTQASSLTLAAQGGL